MREDSLRNLKVMEKGERVNKMLNLALKMKGTISQDNLIKDQVAVKMSRVLQM